MKTIGRIYAVLLECFTDRISAEEAIETIRKILMMQKKDPDHSGLFRQTATGGQR